MPLVRIYYTFARLHFAIIAQLQSLRCPPTPDAPPAFHVRCSANDDDRKSTSHSHRAAPRATTTTATTSRTIHWQFRPSLPLAVYDWCSCSFSPVNATRGAGGGWGNCCSCWLKATMSFTRRRRRTREGQQNPPHHLRGSSSFNGPNSSTRSLVSSSCSSKCTDC